MPDENLEGLTDEGNEPSTDTDANAQADHMKNILDGNSKLGREVKALKETFAEQNEILMDRIAEISENRSAPASNDTYDYNDYSGNDEDEIARIKRIAKEEAKHERETHDYNIKQIRDKYIDTYTRQTKGMANGEDPEVYKAILSEMEGLPGYSDDGASDAKINYQIAERNYYKRMFKTPQGGQTSAFQGKEPAGAPGGATSITNKEKATAEYNEAIQDEAVLNYMKVRGKDADFVKRAMENKTPMQGKMRI